MPAIVPLPQLAQMLSGEQVSLVTVRTLLAARNLLKNYLDCSKTEIRDFCNALGQLIKFTGIDSTINGAALVASAKNNIKQQGTHINAH